MQNNLIILTDNINKNTFLLNELKITKKYFNIYIVSKTSPTEKFDFHVSSKNKYIQSAFLNGEPLNKPWFEHSAIINGGKLTLYMGDRPNKEWGSAPEAAPPSMSF